MTYEHVKTIILTILVIMSSVLTWNIWTYQPEYDTMEDENIVPEVSLSEQKTIHQIVKPDQIYLHGADTHIGTVHSTEIEKVMKELSRWNYDDFENVSNQLNFTDFIMESGHVEIVFPEYVPMEIYKNIFDLQDNDGFDIVFDRIVIDLNNISKVDGYVYFISSDHKEAYKSRVSASFVRNFEENYYNDSFANSNYAVYSLKSLSDNRQLLVRAEQAVMTRYTYLLDRLPTDKFRDALFSDPRNVQRASTSAGEEFTDSSTLLSVNYETNTILYVNPAQESQYITNSLSLLQQSINFVNGHGGWTGNYRYVGIDEQEKTVLFRLYGASGHPIFGNNGMSEILQIWGQTEIHQYMRNNFILSRPVDPKENVLLSGVDTLELLKAREDINPEFIQDLRIGYKMYRDLENPLIHLEPAWFYKYQDQWWMAPTGNEGGLEYGLE